MKAGFRIASLTLAIGMGLILVALLLLGATVATADSAIDLTVETKAPAHVDAGAAYVVKTTTHLSEFARIGEEADAGLVDLTVRAGAPAHVGVDSTYEVNVSYANLGWVPAPDNWVRVTLPEGTVFVSASYANGEPRPPDEDAGGKVLTWNVKPLVANSVWGHIQVTVATEKGLAEGEVLSVLAEIGGSAPESDTDNNTASATSTVYDMAGSGMHIGGRSAMPADVLTYTITINLAEGPHAGSQGRLVSLTNTLPFSHQVRFLGWNGTVTGTQIDGHMLKWQGRVYAGEPRILQYRLGVEGTVTPGMVISNAAMLRWAGHQMQLGPVTTVVTIPHGVLGLGPNQGGQVQHRHGMTLTVPAGAVRDTTRFQMGPLFSDTHPVSPPGGLLFAHRAFELNAFRFGEPVGHFYAPLTITMNYADTDVAGLARETLRVWTRSGPQGPWAEVDPPARVMSGTVTFATPHLSQFALFGESSIPSRKYRIYVPLVMR